MRLQENMGRRVGTIPAPNRSKSLVYFLRQGPAKKPGGVQDSFHENGPIFPKHVNLQENEGYVINEESAFITNLTGNLFLKTSFFATYDHFLHRGLKRRMVSLRPRYYLLSSP